MAKHRPHHRTFAAILAAYPHVKKKKYTNFLRLPPLILSLSTHHILLSTTISPITPMTSAIAISTYLYQPISCQLTNNIALSVQPDAPTNSAQAPMTSISTHLYRLK